MLRLEKKMEVENVKICCKLKNVSSEKNVKSQKCFKDSKGYMIKVIFETYKSR